jgi:hypothetical protein
MTPEFLQSCARLDELLAKPDDDLTAAEQAECDELAKLLVHPDYQRYRRDLVRVAEAGSGELRE